MEGDCFPFISCLMVMAAASSMAWLCLPWQRVKGLPYGAIAPSSGFQVSCLAHKQHDSQATHFSVDYLQGVHQTIFWDFSSIHNLFLNIMNMLLPISALLKQL